ncbi:somatoliberin [Anguilla rostrata]|uniref:somatoliberin n=1 Tax=Anguilla rostrata TaxID=7938 RepID=UPI0030D1CF5A
MMERMTLLVVCCLVMPVLSSPLYPALRFGQRASASILVSSSMEDPTRLLPAPDIRNLNRQERQKAEYRSGRHADAIFTNSYRKVLGQISARKFLQTIMGKRLGMEEAENYGKRDSDLYEEDLTTIQREQRYRAQQHGFHRPSSRCNACAYGRSHTDLNLSGDVGGLKLDRD